MSIIRQSNHLAVVPNFSNLSVLIKIFNIVHMFILLMAILYGNSNGHILDLLTKYVFWSEPSLLLSLLILYFANNWLHNRPASILWTMLIVLLIFSLINLLIFRSEQNAYKLLAVGILSLCLMYYFAWKERIHSPALAEARLVALTSRIRPHFLFNSINAAISLVRQQPDKAEMVLENLADLFRAQLAEPGRTSTLQKEIELAKMYLSIEQERLGERLKVQWTIQAPNDSLLPSLLLQPLLENAVYHGIERLVHPGEITVSVVLIKRRISIAVLNPIDPEHSSTHDGNKIALKNLAERLALIFDEDATLHVNQGNDSFMVRIELPYRSAVDNT